MKRVALVVMPFASTKYPSIQCGLLKAVLAERGIPADVLYLNVELARRIGADLYETLAHASVFLGEWPFARALDGSTPEDERFAADEVRILEARGYPRARYEEACRAAAAFLDHEAAATDWTRYSHVGFSSVFFTQFAALALAKRIKDASPGTKILMGGPNVEGEMGAEALKGFPWVDYVVDGEGEDALLAIVEGRAPAAPAVVRGAKADLSKLPLPDYDDYFEALGRAGLNGVVDVSLWFEASRGCWWGETKHCTFCGLNGDSMAYRTKSPDKVVEEIAALARRHKVCSFMACDSIIDHKAFEPGGLLSKLARRARRDGTDYNIFFETKSNLTRKKVRLLARAGVKRVQPGIESFDDALLKHMRKGVSAIQNVAALRALREHDVDATWLLLYGFPNETADQRAKTLALLPLLTHLQAPMLAQPVALVRYSPYFFEGSTWGVENLGPRPEYGLLYGRRCDPAKMAYDFVMGLPGRPDVEADNEALRKFCRRWKDELANVTFLHFERGPGHVTVYDRRLQRASDSRPLFRKLTLEGLEAEVLARAVDLSTLGELAVALDAPRPEIEKAAARLAAERLVLVEGDRVLSLPLPVPGNPRALHERAQKLETLERLDFAQI